MEKLTRLVENRLTFDKEFMGGRIKVTKNGKVLNELDIPSMGFAYDYETPLLSDFDKECGTYALGQFQLPNPKCPDKFVCGLDDLSVDPELVKFSQCIDAMNCHMLAGAIYCASYLQWATKQYKGANFLSFSFLCFVCI